jgi:hypothetical protein
MGKRPPKGILAWIKRLFGAPQATSNEIGRARQLIAAVDRGGVPLNPARINAIARDLGLDVSAKAPVEETIRRVRAALARLS